MQCNAMQYNVILSSAWRCRRTWRVTPTRRSGPPGGDRITEQLRREILAEKRSGSDARSSQKNGAVQTRDPRRKTERFRREILTHTRRARARHHRSLHLRNAALFILSSGGGAVHARRAATSSSGSSSWRAGMRGRVVRRLVRSARRARRVTVVPFPRARRGASSLPFFRLGWILVLHRIDDASDARGTVPRAPRRAQGSEPCGGWHLETRCCCC